MRVEQMRLELAATLADVGCISAIEEAGLALRRLAGVRASEPDGVLSAPDVEAINCYVDRRRAGEPAQYILGGSEFMGRWFSLNETTYIPRPWTEQMVGRALAILKRSRRPRTVVDVGTGSGAIAAVIAESVRDCHVWALDVDEKALPWARLNTAAAPNVTVLFSDLFDALPPEWAGRVDLVIGPLT